MAELLDDIVAYLAAAGIGLTAGTNLFAGKLPATAPDPCVICYETKGAPPLETFGNDDLPQVDRPRLQVVARAADYVSARTKLWDCFKKLVLIGNESVNGTYYERVEAIDSPALMGRDESERVLFVGNFQVHKAVVP